MLDALRGTGVSFVADNMALYWPPTVERSVKTNVWGPEKYLVEHNELGRGFDSTSTLQEDHTAEKKLIRKVDLRLLPILGGLYAISLVDRVNV